MTETAVCKWCKEPISLKSGWWIDSDNDVLCSHRETDIHEPSPAASQVVNRPLNAADQSAVNAGCTCERKMPYYDWSHAESCSLYKTIVASSTRIDAAPPEVQTVPIPEDLRAFNKYLQDKRQRQLQLSIQDEETCEEIALVERIARAEATIAELKESRKAMKQRAEMAEETLNDVMSESSIDEYLRRELRELVEHVNSLPAGRYSPWLTWWARNAARATGKES